MATVDPDVAVTMVDPSIFHDLGFDELRLKGLCEIDKCRNAVQTMSAADLQEVCNGKSLFTPKQCRKIMLQQLRTLKARFRRTTNAASGGIAFREDVAILLLNLHDLLNAGIGQAHDVVYQKWQPHKFNVYKLVEDVVELRCALMG